MVRITRTAGRWLDSLWAGSRRRLIFVVCVFVAFASLVCYVPRANASSNPSYDSAMASCTQEGDFNVANPSTGVESYTCTVSGQYVYLMDHYTNSTQPDMYWLFTGSPPASPTACATLPTVHLYMDNKLLSGTTFSENAQDPSNGSWIACTMKFTPTGAPVWNPYSQVWQTYGTAAPTGNPSSATDLGSSAGAADWADGSGAPLSPQPPATSTAPVDNPSPPSVCGGGSCYDPATDQYCATSGGAQYCVPGASARTPAGGCGSGSAAVICAGSPTAPPPPATGTSPVSDPATQITSSDKFMQADATTGVAGTVVVNNFAAPGTSTSSGQKSTDSGPAAGGQSNGTDPAHASSAGGNGTLSGGTDCSTPPVCTGDSVLCGVAKTQWATTCQVHKDLAGTGTPPASSSSSSNPAALWGDGTSTGNAVADSANQGQYDSTGFGYGADCPLQDLTVSLPFGSFAVPFSEGCVIGQWIRGVVLAFAMLAAAKITAGANA